MKQKLLVVFILAIVVLLFPYTVYANSSWSWLTDTTPIMILPFAIVFTLAIEIFAIAKFGETKKYLRVAIIVIAANLVSFLLPYLFEIIEMPDPSIREAIKSGLYYIVTFSYIFLTLIIELPIVYLSLRRHTTNRARLLLSILISNIITSVLIAVCERLLCTPALY